MTFRDRPRSDRAETRHPLATNRGSARAKRVAGPAGNPILTTKITPPGVPGWAIRRTRITKLITRGTRCCPLTVLTAPPGAGKTMALALRVAAEHEPVAWVSLDEFDDRPEAFWSHVVAALRRSGAAIPRSLRTAGEVLRLKLRQEYPDQITALHRRVARWYGPVRGSRPHSREHFVSAQVHPVRAIKH